MSTKLLFVTACAFLALAILSMFTGISGQKYMFAAFVTLGVDAVCVRLDTIITLLQNEPVEKPSK